MTAQDKDDYYITSVTATDTHPIRHLVMWPDKPLDFVKLPDDDKGLHYGLYVEDTLVSVVSLFIKDNSAQFRKFATLQSYQGKGYGTLLLNFVIAEATKQGIDHHPIGGEAVDGRHDPSYKTQAVRYTPDSLPPISLI